MVHGSDLEDDLISGALKAPTQGKQKLYCYIQTRSRPAIFLLQRGCVDHLPRKEYLNDNLVDFYLKYMQCNKMAVARLGGDGARDLDPQNSAR
mmetsp:Transcript_19729/g.44734  ORF Transcript_19729/g.44734 Transcript_19729/m.44734 type:complete len:93 (+) Transcript_19729:537-815(+)